METSVIISSTFLLNQLKDIDFESDNIMAVIIENGSMRICLEVGIDIEFEVHHSSNAQTYFDAASYSFKGLIRVLKVIPEQPINLYFGSYLRMKMMF